MSRRVGAARLASADLLPLTPGSPKWSRNVVLPPAVAVEAYDDPSVADLFPAEEAVIAAAVDMRREFATVRRCARAALSQLGVAPVPLLPGVRGAPGWSHGIVGSMTHCAGVPGGGRCPVRTDACDRYRRGAEPAAGRWRAGSGEYGHGAPVVGRTLRQSPRRQLGPAAPGTTHRRTCCAPNATAARSRTRRSRICRLCPIT